MWSRRFRRCCRRGHLSKDAGGSAIGSLKKSAILIPLALFVGSLLFRLVGIGWGMPNQFHNQTYHPDELLNYGVSRGDVLHPHFYNYGTAYFIAEKVATFYGGGSADSWPDIARGIFAGRILSALAGAGAVVVIWLILRRITTLPGALSGALLVAFAPGFLVHSRFETVDVFAVFWLCLSALFALRILGASAGSLAADDPPKASDWKDAILAGAFAGISAGTKYTGVLVILVLWITLGLSRPRLWWAKGLAGTAVCFVAFCLTTPGFFLESSKFWTDFDYELGKSAVGHGLIFIGTPNGFVYHLVNLAIAVGVLATLAGLFALGYGSIKKHSWAIALLAFAVVYYVLIGRAEVKFLRYVFPLLLPIAVGYGYAMGSALRRRTRGSLALATAGVFALVGNPFFDPFGGLIGAAHATFLMTQPDPRDEAAQSIREAAANGSIGLVKDPWFYTPPLIPDAGLNRDQASLAQIYSEIDSAEHPKVMRFRAPGELRVDWDVRLLTELKPDYVVFSSFEADDEMRLSNLQNLDPETRDIVNRYSQFMAELQKSYTFVRPFGGLAPPIHDMMYINPTLWLWKRK